MTGVQTCALPICIDEAAKVSIDLPSKRVSIDSDADLDRIVAAIDAAGYPVSARN